MISEDLMPWFPLMKRRHLNTSAVVYPVSRRHLGIPSFSPRDSCRKSSQVGPFSRQLWKSLKYSANTAVSRRGASSDRLSLGLRMLQIILKSLDKSSRPGKRNFECTGAPNETIVQNHLNIPFLNVVWYLNGRYRHIFIP